MAKKLSETSQKVWDYVKEHDGEQFIAKDIADATGLTVRQVNGSITRAFQIKGLMQRVSATMEIDGLASTVNLIELTDKGRAWDPDAEEEEEETEVAE